MEQLIATIEKGQPFFNAIARNKYLKAIRDGFISVIPIIIFSSIFCLVASVPTSGVSTGLMTSTTPVEVLQLLHGHPGHRLRRHHGQALRRRSEPRSAQEQPDQLHLVHVRGHHRLLAPFERHHRHGRRQRFQHHLPWFQGPADRFRRCVCDWHHLQVLH